VVNDTFSDAEVAPVTSVAGPLEVTDADGAIVDGGRASPGTVTLAKKVEGTPEIGDGDSPAAGAYLPLATFNVLPDPVGDEEIINYNVPAFVFHDATYTAIGVTSNGYLVVGGGDAADVEFEAQALPDPARPNNVLAPFWTDLNGGEGIRVGVLTDGTSRWVVIEWDLAVFGTTEVRSFQAWLGANGTEDISFVWNQTLAPVPPDRTLTIGAENSNGSGGSHLAGLPDASSGYAAQRVVSTPSTPGESASYHVTVEGQAAGTGRVTTKMTAPDVPGTYVVRTNVLVT